MKIETSYLGIPLSSPVILGASDLTTDSDMLKKAEEQGAGAVVYKTLFEEQVQMENFLHDEKMSQYNDIHAEMITLHPDVDHSDIEIAASEIFKHTFERAFNLSKISRGFILAVFPGCAEVALENKII